MLSRLTRLQRITLVLFAIVLANWLMASTTGYTLLGGDLFTVFLILFLVLLSLTLVRPLARKVLWRVRNRLFVTYFLVGGLPVFMMVAISGLALYMLMAASAVYMVKSELDYRLNEISSAARSVIPVQDREVIEINQTNSTTDLIREFPSWSKPGFKGIVRAGEGQYGIAADEITSYEGRKREVFAYQRMDNELLAQLLPGIGIVQFYDAADTEADPDLSRSLDSSKIAPLPPARWIWDKVWAGWPITVYSLDRGISSRRLIGLQARPSLIVARMLSPLGSFATLPVIFLLAVVGVCLVVEFVAVISSAQLTRSITRTVHHLYTGTKKIEAGDFSHRIPIRTKDQLSELAGSFNSMTERVERLLIEVKEKEKLEAELEIARQVQAQLFPREIPKLKTLELAGVCHPARIVSGDYYDFIALDPRWTALVIGDISGKGISAALLMASIQSSLHAQLTAGPPGGLSTATLVARLNRQLYENTAPEKYATFYCGMYDDQSSRLLYTNAGHPAPILLRRGQVLRLESNGMVVGMFPDCPYEQTAIDLQPGDLLSAFTDGITECENARGMQFGEERLTQLLAKHSDKPLIEIAEIATSAVRDWADNLEGQDDSTMLLARRL
jgi:phosphoserine phosphatase RsbU/P